MAAPGHRLGRRGAPGGHRQPDYVDQFVDHARCSSNEKIVAQCVLGRVTTGPKHGARSAARTDDRAAFARDQHARPDVNRVETTEDDATGPPGANAGQR